MTSGSSRLLQELSAQLVACPGEEGGINNDQPIVSNELVNRAVTLYAQRRRREVHFGTNADLFFDPVWDILLGLYVDQRSGRRTTIGNACLTSRVPTTTATRWIATCIQRGLVVRHAHPTDNRCQLLALTEEAVSALERVLADDTGWSGML